MAICSSAQLPAKTAKKFLLNDHVLNELASYISSGPCYYCKDVCLCHIILILLYYSCIESGDMSTHGNGTLLGIYP